MSDSAAETPRWSEDEQSVIDALERDQGRPLTEEEKTLALAQARALGEI